MSYTVGMSNLWTLSDNRWGLETPSAQDKLRAIKVKLSERSYRAMGLNKVRPWKPDAIFLAVPYPPEEDAGDIMKDLFTGDGKYRLGGTITCIPLTSETLKRGFEFL